MTSQPGSSGVCALCGGHLSMGTATIPFVRDDRVVTIKGVPGSICDECGEAYFTGAVLDGVTALIESVASVDTEVLVARYKAA